MNLIYLLPLFLTVISCSKGGDSDSKSNSNQSSETNNIIYPEAPKGDWFYGHVDDGSQFNFADGFFTEKRFKVGKSYGGARAYTLVNLNGTYLVNKGILHLYYQDICLSGHSESYYFSYLNENLMLHDPQKSMDVYYLTSGSIMKQVDASKPIITKDCSYAKIEMKKTNRLPAGTKGKK